jgi:RNA-directed DNA polymerase
VLNGLEQLLRKTFRKSLKGRTNPKVNLVRYADDFIVTGVSKELLEKEVRPVVEQFLRERSLELSSEKTCVTHIEQGFNFLGQNIRSWQGKLLTQPSKRNMHAFLDKVRAIIRQGRAMDQFTLIRVLNPVIRGWVNYHRHASATNAFNKVDRVIWKSLWR